MASVMSRAACEVKKEKEKKEKDNMCTVCMDTILEKDQCERPCGHMMCATCDASWRSRGKIEEIKMQRTDKKSKEKISIYMTVSNCPSCRRKDSPYDYHTRTKVSMFHEIQFLTRTLYLSGIRVPIAYQPPQLNELEEAVTPPPPLLRRIIDVFSPYIPPIAPPIAPTIAPTIAPPIAPIISMSIPPLSQATGICCRRAQRNGDCHTTRTKLKCARCNRFLCRSCRGTGCVCL